MYLTTLIDLQWLCWLFWIWQTKVEIKQNDYFDIWKHETEKIGKGKGPVCPQYEDRSLAQYWVMSIYVVNSQKILHKECSCSSC